MNQQYKRIIANSQKETARVKKRKKFIDQMMAHVLVTSLRKSKERGWSQIREESAPPNLHSQRNSEESDHESKELKAVNKAVFAKTSKNKIQKQRYRMLLRENSH